MKTRKRFSRILSLLLCSAMLFLALPAALFVSAAETPEAPTELASLESYRHASTATVDNNVGLSLNVHTYYDSTKEYTVSKVGKPGSVTVLYVMNTNTERIGQSSDAEIVKSLLDRGFFVLALDYKNAKEACGTALDWSTQDIRAQLLGGKNYAGTKTYTAGTYSDGKLTGAALSTGISYVLPAGYDIAYNIPYFSYDKHGTAGLLEEIVAVWNNEFKSIFRASLVKWVNDDGTPRLDKTDAVKKQSVNDKSGITDYAVWFSDESKTRSISQTELAKLTAEQQKAYPYTYIGNTKVDSVTDCRKPDGSFIDLDLCMDVIYPTGNTKELPVMMCMSSSYTRASTWSSESRPELTGCLFNGYIGIVADYALVPMYRDDHYSHGSGMPNVVSGDALTYSLGMYCGIESDTALIRTVRKMGVDGISDAEGKTLKVAVKENGIGAYGNSKGGLIIRLGAKHPELQENARHFEGHLGETRYEAMGNPSFYGYTDPFIQNGATTDARIRLPEAQPALTYGDGSEIPSGLNLVYANCGGKAEMITEDHCAVFGMGTQKNYPDCSYWTFYRQILNLCRNTNVPFLGLVCPNAGHDLGHGPDKDYGIDTYEAFLRYCDYWLKDGNAECMIIDVDTANEIGIAADVPIDRIYEISETSSIKFQFTGPVDLSEISKIRITDAATGEELTGEWSSIFGDQQWKFLPYDIKDGTYYRIEVPSTVLAKNGKPLKETKTMLFRTAAGLTEAAESSSGSSTLTDGNMQYVVFRDADRNAAHKTILRFTVTNDAVNTIEIHAVTSYNEADPSASVIGEKLGEVLVTGAGTYGFDVTEYMRSCKGKAVFRLSTAGASQKVLNSYDMEGKDKNASISGFWCSNTTRAFFSDEAKNADGSANTSYKLDYFVRSSSYIDLNNDLANNAIGNLSYFASVNYGIRADGTLSAEKDIGRRFVISFRIYDETSRLVSVRMGDGINTPLQVVDFNGEDLSFYTKANEWVTVSLVMTITKENAALSETLRKALFVITAENKSVAVLDDYVTVAASGMAVAGASRGTNYAGTAGLNDKYTNYKNTKEAEAAGKITVNHSRSAALYVDDVTFTEVKTDVALAGVPTLSVLPQNTSDTLPVEASYVTSKEPSVTPDNGTLSVGGGESGFDTVSVKTYVKLSLENYANTAAGLVFRAKGPGKVLVYGVADAASGQSWTRESINPTNAPANDLYGAGVNLAAVFGNAPLGSFTSTASESVFSLNITDYAKAMKAAGASSVTLIFVSGSNEIKEISSYDFETKKPSVAASGYAIPKISDNVWRDHVFKIQNGALSILTANHCSWADANNHAATDPTVPATGNPDQNVKLLGVFDSIWADKANIGKTYRITFKASATLEGKLNLSMTTNGDAYNATISTNYHWKPFPDFNTSVNLTTTEQTFTVEFTATESMFTLYNKDKTVSSKKLGLALRFFEGFKNDDGTYKDTVITLDDLRVEEVPSKVTVSLVDKTPDIAIGENDFKSQPPVDHTGYKGVVWQWENEEFQLVPAQHVGGGNSGQNVQLKSLLDPLWKNASYVGKTVRITFRAKSTIDGTLDLGLSASGVAYTFRDGVCINTNKDAGYRWERFPGATGNAALTGDWKTYTFDFTVTEEMYPDHLMNQDGSAASGAKLNLCFTMFNGFKNADGTYKDVTISIDDVKAVVLNDNTPVAYNASFDFKTSKTVKQPGFGYLASVGAIGRVENETLVLNPSRNYDGKTQKPTTGNYGQNIQIWNLLDGIFGDTANKGKTYRIKFTAKASEVGKLHVSIATDKSAYMKGTTTDLVFSSFPGTVNRYDLTTEYQTYVMEFTANAEMFPDNLMSSASGTTVSGAKPQIAFRLYEGFRKDDGYYKDVNISLKTIEIEELPTFSETSLTKEAAAAVSGSGASDTLAVYPNPEPIAPADIKRAYLTFKTASVSDLYEAWLTLTATEATGQKVTIYAMNDLTLPGALTYENAPLPTGAALTSFYAKKGENRVDISDYLRANAGHKITFVLAIEEAGSDVVFDNTTSLPTLTIGSAPTTEDFDESAFRVKSNITLWSDFGYNTYVPVLDAVKEITLDGKSPALYTLEKKVIDGQSYYCVPFRIAAKDGTDTHTLEVKLHVNGELRTKTYNVSLPNYAKKLLASTGVGEEAKTLVRDMLSYVGEAMTCFGTSTAQKQETIATLIGADYNGALAAEKLPAVSQTVPGLSSARLSLGATPAFIFYPENATLADTFRFTAGSVPLTSAVKVGDDGRTYIEVTTYAYGMLRTVSYTYTDADGKTQSGSYNLAAYYAYDGLSAQTKSLVLHLAKYADSANAYKNSVTR